MYTGDIYQLIVEKYSSLTTAEKKVADCLLRKKAAVSSMSISDIAATAGVAPATVTRFCHFIGLESFSECKLCIIRTISHEESSTATTDDVYRELLPTDSVEEKCQKLYTISSMALMQTLSMLDAEKISQAIDLLTEANHVYCFGQGSSCSTAMDAWERFSCVTPKFQWIGEYRMQAYAASILGEGDVVLYFSFSGAFRELSEIGRLMQNTKAKLILVTRYENSPGAKYADLIIICGANESPHHQGTVSVKIGQLFMIDILFNEFCARNLIMTKRNKEMTTEASKTMLLSH